MWLPHPLRWPINYRCAVWLSLCSTCLEWTRTYFTSPPTLDNSLSPSSPSKSTKKVRWSLPTYFSVLTYDAPPQLIRVLIMWFGALYFSTYKVPHCFDYYNCIYLMFLARTSILTKKKKNYIQRLKKSINKLFRSNRCPNDILNFTVIDTLPINPHK